MAALILLLSSLAFGQQTTTRLDVVYNGATPGRIRGFEQGLPKGNYIDLVWPSSMAANSTLTMPKENALLLATENHQFSATDPFTFATYRARGTEASPGDINAGDPLGHWTGYGRTGGSYMQLAGIQLGTPTTTTGGIDFWTRNAVSYGPRLNISSDGHLYPYGVGTQDIGASSVRFRKGWFVDLDISGACTGCGGSPPITWTLETNADILTMQHHLSTGTVARNILTQYSRGTNASPLEAVAGDSVFSEKWQYYAGGAYRDAGAIFVNVPSGATVSGVNSPGHIGIFATPHGSTSGAEVVRFGAQTFSETPSWGAKWFAGFWPSANLTYDVGAFGAEWLSVWTSRIRTSGSTSIGFYPGNSLGWTMQVSPFHLIPSIDLSTDIGSSAAKVRNVWAAAFHTYTHNSWGIQLHNWAADNSLYHRLTSYGAGTFPVVEFRKARGTEATPSVLSDGDTIAYHLFEGYSPSGAFVFSGYIQSYVDGTPSGSIVPSAIALGTMNAAGSVASRLTVRASGDVLIPGNLTVSGTCTGCGGATPPLDLHLDSGSTVLTLSNHGTVSASQLVSRFSRGTYASPSDTVAGDLVGNHTFRYYAGGAYRDAAAIFVNATSGRTISASSAPTHLSLFATAQFNTSGTEVARFGELGGSFGFGTEFFSTVYPSSNLTLDLGAAGIEWLTVWASRIRTTGSTAIDFYPGNTHRWSMTTTNGSLVPVTNAGPSIGNVTTKPNEIWAMEHNTYTHNSWGTQESTWTADNNLNFILTSLSGSAASDRASLQFHRTRGSLSSPAAVQFGDQLGNIAFQGLGSSSLGVGAVIRVYAAAAPGTNYVPSEMWLQTVDTSGVLNANLVIRADGEVDFAAAVDATSGFKYNGTAGITQTISVRKGDDSAACNIVVSGGIITSTTC